MCWAPQSLQIIFLVLYSMRIRRAVCVFFFIQNLVVKMSEKVRDTQIFWVPAKLPTNVGRHLIYVEFFKARSVCYDYGMELACDLSGGTC